MALDLSLDLVEEILSRVPARSLLRLRCTCKQWETLIAKPWFVKKHLSHMRCREQQFIVFCNEYEHGVSSLLGSAISYVGIDFNKQVKYDLKLPFPIALSPAISISHCDGLLLYASRGKLWVLNPMLEQKRGIKYNQRFDHSSDVFGLGYITNQSSSSYDYKVVSFRCGGRTEDSSRVEVYAFKSDSWKVVVDKNFDGFYGLPLSSVCLRGTPYWLGYKKGANNLLSIQSFDFLKERFEPLFLPPSSIDESCNLEICQSLGIFRGDQLSLLLLCYKTLKMHLWVMKKQQWSRQMTVDGLRYQMNPKYSSFIERNGRLALYVKSGRIRIYIVRENQDYYQIGDFSSPGPFCDSCYVPSLLQVPGVSKEREIESCYI